MARITFSAREIKIASIATRTVQFLLSLVALVTISAGFVNTTANDFTFQFGSHESNFTLVTTYTSVMYAAWFLVCVELFPMVNRPRRCVVRVADTLLAIMMTASAIALVGSDYVQKCQFYTSVVHCKTIKTSVAFSFASVLPLITSVVLTYAATPAPESDLGYVQETTPTAAKRDMATTDSSKV